MGRIGLGTVAVLMMMLLLLMVVGIVPAAEGAKETAAEHRVRVREAVREKYMEWLDHWGVKHEAKQAALRSAHINIGTAAAAGQAALTSGAPKVIVVDKNGNGDVTTVQAAIDRVPKKNNQRIDIQINAGTYEYLSSPFIIIITYKVPAFHSSSSYEF